MTQLEDLLGDMLGRLARLESAQPGGGAGFHNSDVIARLLATDSPPNPRIEIGPAPTNQIRFYTGLAGEVNPASITGDPSGALLLQGTDRAGGNAAALSLGQGSAIAPNTASVQLSAGGSGDIQIGFAGRIHLEASQLFINTLSNAADMLGAWTAFTPSFTSTGVQPTMLAANRVGRYWRFGKTVLARMLFSWTAIGAGEAIGTGFYQFACPFAIQSPNGTIGAASMSGATRAGVTRIISATQVALDLTTGPVSATSPAAPVNGDTYGFDLLYETT